MYCTIGILRNSFLNLPVGFLANLNVIIIFKMSVDSVDLILDFADPSSLHSFVSKLGDGFEDCCKSILQNNIGIKFMSRRSHEDDLIAELQESGIRSNFHQKVIARNILAWKSCPATTADVANLGGTLPFPKEGIKLSSLEIFINECGGRSVLDGLSTTDVNNLFQKPLTIHMKSSYCDYLKTIDVNSVGEAQVFISHAWKYKFLDVVDTMRYHFRDNPHIIIWFDLFSNNQHGAPDLDFYWWSTTFKSAIVKFNYTVMILSPWNNPIPLTRAWCLFEIYCTAECKCKFEVAISQADQENFLEAIQISASKNMDRRNAMRPLHAMLATIDVRKSESWNPDDKYRIFDAVERSVGFVGINKLVFERLRDWVIDAATISLQNCSSEENRATAQQSLGLLCCYQARYDLAEPLLLDSLKIRERLVGEKHPDTITSYNDLAFVYQNTGRYEQALPLHMKCVSLRIEIYGEKHQETLSSMNYLAGVYKLMGRYNEALPYCVKCLTVREEILGENHPHTIMATGNLAGLYDNMGKCGEALPLHIQCLAMAQSTLEEKYSYVLATTNNQNGLQGKYEGALPLHTKCLDMREEVLGDKHPHTILTMSNWFLFHQNLPNYDRLISSYIRSLQLVELILGEKHPNTIASINNFAGWYDILGRYEEALSLYTKCLAIEEEVLGEKHPNTLQSMHSLAGVYQNMSRYETALPLYTKCLALREEVLGEKHPDTLTTMYYFAGMYGSMGRCEEAVNLCNKCFVLRVEALGEKHPITLRSMHRLAGIYLTMRRYEEALPLYTKCLALREEVLGEKHPDTLICMNNLAGLYDVLGNYDVALSLYTKCLAIRKDELGEEHPDSISTSQTLASLCNKLGRHNED